MNAYVLVVEDSDVDRKVITHIIEKKLPSSRVIGIDKGASVDGYVLKHDIDVCILDLKLPDISGIDVLQMLKENEKTKDIPVIICSGDDSEETLSTVLSLGAYDYFIKPLSSEDMRIGLPLKVKNAIELHFRSREMKRLIQLDRLTGLYNRVTFKELLSQCVQADAISSAVMMVDVNGLKMVNDAYGSDIGDVFLLKVKEVLLEACPSNAMVSRWGGDEFAAWLPQVTETQMEDMTIRMKSSFAAYSIYGVHLSLSIGWEMCKLADTRPLKLLASAEDAMFRDKIFESISVRSNMITVLIETFHAKNPREEQHSHRVSELSHMLAMRMALSEKLKHDIKAVALLHDIGKIAIDEAILNKEGKLLHDEWQDMRRHPEIGFRILSSSPSMKEYAYAVLCHHERYDGKGYPNGLLGLSIPLMARILAIADSYDAMTSQRTYKKCLSKEEAILELKRCRGSQFDPEIVDLFIDMIRTDDIS